MGSQSVEPALQHFVRVTGRRRRFIEFDYAIGSPDLAIELILPVESFHEFCRRNGVTMITDEQGAALDRERAEWREKSVGDGND